MLGLFGCENKKKDIVFELFKKEIEKNGMKIDSIDNEGLIHIQHNGITLKVSLDNTRKNYERDKDETYVKDLVNILLKSSSEIPDWDEAKKNIYISFFTNDFDFQNIVHKKITDEFSKIYVYSNNEMLTWVTNDYLKKHALTEEELEKKADSNARLLLEKSTIDIETIENRKLGLINVNHISLKGSLLFASNMKDKVMKDFGFPFYAVIPVRDFCYIFSEKDFDYFSSRLGSTVVKEYKESGYPITTEVLKFTDKGVEAVGKYPVE